MDSQNEKPKRKVGRPFPKGVSPNPGGRPKGYQEVSALAREHGPHVIAKLREWTDNEKAPLANRILAANSLYEKGFGKPSLHNTVDIEITLGDELDSMGADGIREWIVERVIKDRKLALMILEALEADAIPIEAEPAPRPAPAPSGIRALPPLLMSLGKINDD